MGIVDGAEFYRKCVARLEGRGYAEKRLASLAAETWRPCVGFIRYEVSSCGGVRRIGSRGNQPLVFKRSDGKLAVRLTAASRTYIRSIDRLVEEAFTR
jgi:hypothetical protein